MKSDLRVAIIGGGPAGLYAAAELARRQPLATVNMIDRLPCIGGLARYGVAPDHAERRKVIEAYERLARSTGSFEFFGNLAIGDNPTHDDLMRYHHAVIYATGAFNSKALRIPGAARQGCWSSRDFVAWYNGHPDYANLDINLDCERAVVIGNGNVALDIARLLLKSNEELAGADMPPEVLDRFRGSRIREVVIVGRRGPAQAKFTYPELLELGKLEGVAICVNPEHVSLDGWPDGDYSARLKRCWFENLAAIESPAKKTKQLKFEFLASPAEIRENDAVTGLSITRNLLEPQRDGSVCAVATADSESFETGLIVHALGYQAMPITGLPFDEPSNNVPNVSGRVRSPNGESDLVGTYVTGWIKRGPRGVIGGNKVCAVETIATLLADYGSNRLRDPSHTNADFEAWVRNEHPATVNYHGWKAIDRYEKTQATGDSPRRKLIAIDQMLDVAGVHAS